MRKIAKFSYTEPMPPSRAKSPASLGILTLCAITFFAFAVFTKAAQAQSSPSVSPSLSPNLASIEFDRIQDGILYFAQNGQSGTKPPAPLDTHLTDAQLIGVLRALPGGEPYALMTGKTCKDCLADPGLFALPPSGGKPNGYLYPGKIFQNKTRALVYEGRAFYGRCLSRKPVDVLVIFQREIVDRKHGLLKSVLIAEPALEHEGGLQSHLHETLLESRLPSLNDTLKWVKKRQCTEIAGRNRVMLSHPLDVQLRGARGLRNEDDEDNDKTDEDESGDP
jgi:hypothetical protein